MPTVPGSEKQLLDRHLGPFVSEWGQTVQTVTPMRIAIYRKIDDDPRLLCMNVLQLPFAISKLKPGGIRPHPLSKVREVGIYYTFAHEDTLPFTYPSFLPNYGAGCGTCSCVKLFVIKVLDSTFYFM